VIKRKTPIGTIGVMGGVGSVAYDFMWSLAQMVQFNNEYLCGQDQYIHLSRATVSYHPVARNELVTKMQGDWLLQLDTDHAFNPNLLIRMLRLFNGSDPKVDVLTGIYTYRAYPHQPVLFQFDGQGMRHVGGWEDPEAPLARVSAGGAGCLLVRRSVFDHIRDNWRNEKGEKEGPFNIIPPYSEDNSFFIRCLKLGIPVYAALKVECHHLTTKRLTMDDFDKTYATFDKEPVR
jgi:hypothetical protein